MPLKPQPCYKTHDFIADCPAMRLLVALALAVIFLIDAAPSLTFIG
jgi:hypothetical protein